MTYDAGLDTSVEDAAAAYNALYLPLIQTYFPADQVANAECVLLQETIIAALSNPNVAPADRTTQLPLPISCIDGKPATTAQGYGLFGIADACWSPAIVGAANTPLTMDDWNGILDPNVNVWAASVVWSVAGWRAWSTCVDCGACDVTGMPIPFPRAPVTQPAGGPYQPTTPSKGSTSGLIVAGLGVVAMVALALTQERRY